MGDVSEDGYNPNRETTGGIGPSIAIAALIGSILLIAIIILRRLFPRYFMPKGYHSHGLKHPPDLQQCSGWVNWIPYTIRYKKEDLFEEYGGLDMIQYLTFLKYSILLFALISFIGIASLITNVTADGQPGVEGDMKTSMANIGQRSKRLWVHAISVLIVSIFVYVYAWKLGSSSSLYRAKHIRKELPYGRSVMVTNLRMEHSNHSSLKELFISLYGRRQVSNAFVAPDVREIEKIRKKREELAQKYRVAYHYHEDTGKDKLVREGKCGPKRNAREYYEKEIRRLDDQISTMQGQHHNLTRCGFVSFNSVASALMCAQTRHDRDSGKMNMYFSPDPKDVMWENLNKGRKQLVIRYIISTIITVLLFAFWWIPVAFFSAFSNIETISAIDGFGWLDWILDINTFVRGIIVGFLPNLALIIFMALLPTILTAIFNIRCYYLMSQRERAVGTAYYVFLLLNVFLIVTLAGSATRNLNRYINSPGDIPQDLAQSLPGQALFYFNYTAIHAFVTNLIFLIGIPNLLIYILKKFTSKSNYEKDSAAQCRPLPYFKTYANDLIIFTVGLVFSVMNPLVSLMVCIYFCVAFFIIKYYLIFIHKADKDGIKMNQTATTGSIIATFIFQLTMIGLFSILVAAGGFIALVCFIATIIFTYVLYREYQHIEEFAPLIEFPRPAKSLVPTNVSIFKPAALTPPNFDNILHEEVHHNPFEADIENQKMIEPERERRKTASEIIAEDDPFNNSMDDNNKSSKPIPSN